MTTKQYRCCFTDADGSTQTTEQITVQTDADALLEVERLMASSQSVSAELWDGNRLVGKWDNTRSIAGSHASASEARSA